MNTDGDIACRYDERAVLVPGHVEVGAAAFDGHIALFRGHRSYDLGIGAQDELRAVDEAKLANLADLAGEVAFVERLL